MGCLVDHLSSDYLVRVTSRFRDARGRDHEAGERGVIRRIYLDHAAGGEIVIEWERSGDRDARETMYFRLDAREGPRSGAMKEYFEVVEYSPGPRSPRPAPQPPQPPPDGGDPSSASTANVWALAARGRFEEARAELLAILGNRRDPQSLAEEIGAAAEAHAFDANSAVYDWLKEWSINLWYQWGSGATSGGEGTERRGVMDVAERRFEELERQRLQVRPRTVAPR